MVGLIDTPGAHAEWTFPAEPGAVRTARHTVRDKLIDWRAPASVVEAVVLLVSELVTNAMRYTSGPIGVRLAVVEAPRARDAGAGAAARERAPGPSRAPLADPPAGPSAPAPSPRGSDAPGAPSTPGPSAGGTGRVPLALLVEVSDPLPDPPAVRAPGPDDEGGRGLRLVACSSRRWGTRRGKTGKTVWFELPLPG